MLKVTYRMNRWPDDKTAFWIAADQAWVDYVALVYADSLSVLSTEDAAEWLEQNYPPRQQG